MKMDSGSVTTSDRERIMYDHYRSGRSQVIILAHGFYNSKKAVLFQDMARALADHYDVIVMDFRGHGDSSGRFSWTAKEPMDLEAILEYARGEYSDVGIIGFSLGAAVSLIVAAQKKGIRSLISMSAPCEFGRIDFRFWQMGIMENIIYNVFQEGRIGKGVRPGLLWRKKVRPADIVGQIRVPVLFIHGGKDWLIAPWHSERLMANASEAARLEVIPDGTHAEFIYRSHRERVLALFLDWFAKTMPVVN